MTISGNSNRQYFISMNDVSIIKQCTEESDLGVMFTTDLKFSCHINNAMHKASKMIGIIHRTFHAFTPHTLRLLYTSLVRDYACNHIFLKISEYWKQFIFQGVNQL